ncbi:MAG TPA: PSD1 and planctomycete cytochrome C domain-containing protein, partial [Planctomycetaceae bacterium]|nr:PSD1 and planctomycete cytochrome C domain-containing protein [Planctomycetaceae bacterium]
MMRLLSSLILIVAGSVLAPAEQPVDFARDIRPILSDKCAICHGPDENQRQADLRLDTKVGALADLGGHFAIVPGKPDESQLVQRITSDDPDERMPPADSKRTLSPEQIELLRRWIAEGAKWEEHWSFSKPQRAALPAVEHKSWPRNEIDYFILQKLEQAGLAPAPEAVKETLIRRATLDLTGLPSTLAEVDAFLADESPEAYEKVVDRLLASPRYGEHMATAWLDVARYSDSNGYQGEQTRTMWPWRDWVVKALNDNMPFDQFTIEQIAGDLLDDSTREQLVATGFHRNHMLNGEGGRIAEESRVDYVIDRVNTTSTTWLGLTMACCQCHDHKYDPISQIEFYRMYAYFNNIEESGGVDAGGNANPVIPLPTKSQQNRESQLVAELTAVQEKLKAESTGEKQIAWENQVLADLASSKQKPYWIPLAPLAAVSEQGQTLDKKEDGSIFVSGTNPDNDNYTLTFVPAPGSYTGIRLDALKHESFTNGGLARSDSGNFVLTDLVIEIQSAEGTSQQVKIASGQADFEQGGHPITNSFDDNPKSGWAVHNPNDMKHDRSAAFAFAAAVEIPADAKLVVTLKHESPHVKHNLGWFRLSITSEPAPKLNGTNALPPNVLTALETAAEKRSEEQKKLLAEQFRKSSPEVVAAQKQADQAQKRLNDHRNSYIKTMVMKDRSEPRETYRLQRGAWDNPDKSKLLTPGVPAILPPLPESASENRLALAKWLVSRENPLTARVTVNRYWQQLMGTGIVTTTEDFGTQGDLPSHPELLDWLSVEFMESGWDVKAIQKKIVMSATYRQSSQVTEQLLAHDPLNRLLSRGPRFRLSAQQIRDQALFLSGLLVEQIGGEPVKPYQPAGVWLDLT